MPQTWAKVSGVDLHLDLSGTRVRAGLETALRGAVRGGRLPPGTRLPSSRALAADLGIARNTVAEVYSQLVAEGWLTAQTGSGTCVAPRRAPGRRTGAQSQPPTPVPRYDLRPGVPDLSAFPRREWLATARKVLAAAPDYLLGYPDPRGLPPLRAALAGYLARARGVTADPGHIVICAGFAHGLAATCRALRATGARTLAVEAYGHQQHRDIAAGPGLGLRPVPVDRMGAVIGAASGADAALLTPAHQFPLGVTLHPRRRREVAAWGGVVIEDDYDGEFRYDRQPVGALQALAPDHVIYAGTASKSLAPGLRLGWLVVPPRLLDAVTAELAAGPSGLDQLTLAEFITSGGYDRQVRRARLAYRRRRDRLTAVLAGLGLGVSGISAGLHAVLPLSRTECECELLARAASHGLALDGLDRYRAPAALSDRAGLVIGYARPPGHAYTTALARLRAILTPDAPEPRELLPVPYPRPGLEPRRPVARTQGCVVAGVSRLLGVIGTSVSMAEGAERLKGMSNVLIWAAGARGPGADAAGPAMTLAQVVVTAVAAITVFVAVLAAVLEVSRRRGRRRTGNRDARPGSFGRQGEEEYEGVPGYGRPAGYEPPPLWTDSPADPRSGWS